MSSRRRMARILNKMKRRHGNRFRVRAFQKKEERIRSMVWMI